MQDDIELLGLAAKAAGIELQWARVIGSSPRRSSCWSIWNPLIDDADALRLAVKLRMHINWGHCSERGEIVFIDDIDSGGDDMNAAVRLAIVMAAAEIGRGME